MGQPNKISKKKKEKRCCLWSQSYILLIWIILRSDIYMFIITAYCDPKPKVHHKNCLNFHDLFMT